MASDPEEGAPLYIVTGSMGLGPKFVPHIRIETVPRVVRLLCMALQTAVAFWHLQPRVLFRKQSTFPGTDFAFLCKTSSDDSPVSQRLHHEVVPQHPLL